MAWLEELSELVAIPSVSADPAHGDDVKAAAEKHGVPLSKVADAAREAWKKGGRKGR